MSTKDASARRARAPQSEPMRADAGAPAARRRRGWWNLPIINRRSWTWRDANRVVRAGEWYQNAVIYQIAPWGFQDTDGDGRGDLPGIIRRLDYITSLGVDAIWLTPIFPSPMHDMGYDVSGTRDIGRTFGTMADFERLLTLVHQRGMKLILDMVWNHTSKDHAWFRESRSSRTNDKADWYVWADPAEDGGPPNNWPSVLTGESGWCFDDMRGQYYFSNFLQSQPDLNWHNEAVRAEILDIARYWLDLGIDGMRLDAVNFFCHDALLRDNPLRGEDDGHADGIDPDNPAAAQVFCNSFCREETFEMLRPLRRLADEYPGVVLLGEVTLCEDSIEEAARYTRGRDRLHLSYNSGLLFKEPMTATRLRALIEKASAAYGEGGTCWIVGNHDYGRMRSLWAGAEQEDADAFFKMMSAVLLSLPGALCLWQGDELGLDEARIPEDIAPEQLQDPFGRMLYPRLNGRDGSRTPMPWDDERTACDFSDDADRLWLPIPEQHRARSVARQTGDPDSVLNVWRTLLHWRIGQPALQAGAVEFAELESPILGLIREYGEQRLLCLFNISAERRSVDLSAFSGVVPAHGLGFASDWDERARSVTLPPWGVFMADLRSAGEMRRMHGSAQAAPAAASSSS
ncbi:alpha-amylase family glycosyl hydrolase [Sinimarinibacterium flocculans]|uniref:alpha-amylase family glycosyl hydrolase n=1 Tax=Sinimarinibacterium flocculans TaxID=985250 RepID=UPI00351776E5